MINKDYLITILKTCFLKTRNKSFHVLTEQIKYDDMMDKKKTTSVNSKNQKCIISCNNTEFNGRTRKKNSPYHLDFKVFSNNYWAQGKHIKMLKV